MPAIFWLQCLSLASSSRAWPAPTMLNLMAVKLQLGNEYNRGKTALAFLQAIAEAIAFQYVA